MLHIKTSAIPASALFFMILAPFATIFYASYVYNVDNIGNIYLYVLQLIADTVSISLIGSLWITILLDLLQPEYHKRSFHYSDDWVRKHKPTVDVVVPVANEPIDIIRDTLTAAVNLEYPHKTFVFDDGHSFEVENLAKELKVNYVSRPKENKKFAKSGNINHGLQESKSEYFVVFDADFVPKKNFITRLLPFFENENVSLVQTPQVYSNTENFIASGTSQAQEIFYKYVQPAKNSYNAAFCVGTNVMYRRSAVDSIGGIALRDHSEDIWTTILLHEKGFDTVFLNDKLAIGRAPETITAFFRQQNRWARGGFTLFFQKNPLFIEGMTIDQRFQYFFSNIHYFSGFSMLIYLLLPLLFLLTGEHAMKLTSGSDWLLHYLPFFGIVYFLPWFLLGKLKLSTIATSAASFYPYLAAFTSVILKNNFKWVATEAKKVKTSAIMQQIWPHMLVLFISTVSLFVGWFRPIDIISTSVSSFWVLINMYIMSSFIINGLNSNA